MTFLFVTGAKQSKLIFLCQKRWEVWALPGGPQIPLGIILLSQTCNNLTSCFLKDKI